MNMSCLNKFLLFFIFLVLSSCNLKGIYVENNNKLPLNIFKSHENDSTFVNVRNYTTDFIFDMKYATEDNFLKQKVYPCASCFLRVKTVKALIKANQDFLDKGYRIKLFDCYRPLDIQKVMWKMVPNSNFVANPQKGSIHNRGGAVDITIVDSNGKELDMGTSFDFFGPESSHFYNQFPETVLMNRKLLKEIMTQNHFISFDSEWWHYNLKNAETFMISNFKWECE